MLLDMISQWIPPVVMSAILAVGAWVGLPKLLAASIERTVQHKLDERLERIRAELRSAEASIDVLRANALSGAASRQGLLDARRLVAAERLWSAVVALSSAKSLSLVAGSIKLDELLKSSEGTGSAARKVQQFASMMLKSMLPDGYKFDPTPDCERPFVSAQAWSLFVAYRMVVAHPVLFFTLAESGMGATAMKKDPAETLAIVKAALPHFSDYIDKFGVSGFHLLIPRLEERLLEVLSSDLRGVETTSLSVDEAAEIIRKADAAFSNLTASRAGETPAELRV